MKKIRFFACAAACAMLGTMAFMACSSDEEEEEVHLTEEQLEQADSAFSAVASYNGGYTINETAEATIDTTMSYGGMSATMKETAVINDCVTYDEASGSMALVISEDYNVYIDGVLSDDSDGMMNSSAGYYDMYLSYYTYVNEGTYTQYASIDNYLNSSKYDGNKKYTYTSAGYLSFYYTTINSFMKAAGIDFEEVADCSTEEDYNLFWQDYFASALATMSANAGVSLSYTPSNSSLTEETGYNVYMFSAYVDTDSANVTVGSLKYAVYMYVNTTTGLIDKLEFDIDQTISYSSSGLTETIVNKCVTTDEFVYSSDTSKIPGESTLTGYTAAN